MKINGAAMPKPKLSNERAALLATLERIVGGHCYNGNIQNYGPGGSYEGAGRSFRYPLTVIDGEGNKRKASHLSKVSPEVLATGFYAFGANRLEIIDALDLVLTYLEKNHELKL